MSISPKSLKVLEWVFSSLQTVASIYSAQRSPLIMGSRSTGSHRGIATSKWLSDPFSNSVRDCRPRRPSLVRSVPRLRFQTVSSRCSGSVLIGHAPSPLWCGIILFIILRGLGRSPQTYPVRLGLSRDNVPSILIQYNTTTLVVNGRRRDIF